MICFVLVAIAIVCFILCGVFENRYWLTAFSMIFCLIGFITGIVGTVNTIRFIDSITSYEADCAMVASTRAVYVDELKKYDEMRDTDVTASETYLELREKIIDFNHDVDFAKTHDNIWLRNSWFNPAYLTVDTIDLGVG